MIEPSQQAPGCFGAASVYSLDSQACQACVAFQQCGDKSLATLEAIKATVKIDDILARHKAARVKAVAKRPAPPAPVEQSPIPTGQPKLPAKVERKTSAERVVFTISAADEAVLAQIGEKSVKTQAQAIVLCKQNKINEMREALPKGSNPFATSGPGFMRVLCDMLIGGSFTKATLKARMMQELDWTDGTAGSHVAMGFAIVHFFNIAVVSGNEIILNPALKK